MSKIGKKFILLPAGVTLEIQSEKVVVKGPKGLLEVEVPEGIQVKLEDNQVKVERTNNQRQTKAFHGLVRSLINNAVIGVSQGYKKVLKLVGTGYRVTAKGKGLDLSVGYSHTVEFTPPEGVTVKVEGNDTIVIEGIDKQLVGEVAANIRKVKPPDAYKGKGIRYEDEVVHLKPGKTASA